jgi:hypothetical protein
VFHGHLDYLQSPPLGGRPNRKPLGGHGTPNTHNCWVILFHHVWGPTWIEVHWNSIWLRAQSRMTSHYTWGSVTALHDFGGVLGRHLDTIFWALTISWSWLFTHKIESPWSCHFKHSYWWKRWRRSKFTSHCTWGTNRVSTWMQDGCKVNMDSYMASNGSCFMVTWTIFKVHLLEVGLTKNRGETMALRTLTIVDSFYFIMCENLHELEFIEIPFGWGPCHIWLHTWAKPGPCNGEDPFLSSNGRTMGVGKAILCSHGPSSIVWSENGSCCGTIAYFVGGKRGHDLVQNNMSRTLSIWDNYFVMFVCRGIYHGICYEFASQSILKSVMLKKH